MAKATGSAVASWATKQSNVTLQGNVAGVVGGGTVLGKFTVLTGPGPVVGAFSSAGMTGTLAPQMALALGLGIMNGFNSAAQYQGSAVGAIGGDVSTVKFALSAPLISGILKQLAAGNITGTMATTYAIGAGNGIAAMVKGGTGTGTASGGGGPFPSTGTSISALV